MIGFLAANTTQVSLPTFTISNTVVFVIGLVLGVVIRGKF